MYKLLQGNCRDALREIAEQSIDAVVTDPPYEIAFDRWDSSGIAHDSTLWAEVLRVLKPGGYLLAFSGARLYHHLAVAIEGAGWNPTLKPCVDPVCVARRPMPFSHASRRHRPRPLHGQRQHRLRSGDGGTGISERRMTWQSALVTPNYCATLPPKSRTMPQACSW